MEQPCQDCGIVPSKEPITTRGGQCINCLLTDGAPKNTMRDEPKVPDAPVEPASAKMEILGDCMKQK